MKITLILPILTDKPLLPFPEDGFPDGAFYKDGDTLLLFDDSSESDRVPFFSSGSGRISRAGFLRILVIIINICCNSAVFQAPSLIDD